jgi:hypothetical protein
MRITTKEVLSTLKQSGRNRLTERQLTDFRQKQLLPQLQRFNQPGSRKPLYLWDEDVVAQVAYLHDLLQWDRQHDRLYLPLWLAGYDIPLRAIHRLTVRFIEKHLSKLTQGRTDTEEILDQVSTLVYESLLPRWKYSPKKNELVQIFGVGTWANLVECVFEFFAVPFFEPDPDLLADLLLQLMSQEESGADFIKDQEHLSRTTELCLLLFKKLSPLFSIPKLKEAVDCATPEEWMQARHYYQELHSTVDFILIEIDPYLNTPFFSDVSYYRTAMNGALCLLPSFLSLIHHGYSGLLEKGKYVLRLVVSILKRYGWSQRHPDEVIQDMANSFKQHGWSQRPPDEVAQDVASRIARIKERDSNVLLTRELSIPYLRSSYRSLTCSVRSMDRVANSHNIPPSA